MTKQDYELIATRIRLARLGATTERNKSIDVVVEEMVMGFERENSRFDAAKFRAACQARN